MPTRANCKKTCNDSVFFYNFEFCTTCFKTGAARKFLREIGANP